MQISFCRNCGKELIGIPYYCMNCGARPLAGKSFCPSCANPTTALSEICVKCGRSLIQTAEVQAAQPVQTVKPLKSKATSIWLAVLLHFGTWIYTYRRDNWKFWVGLGIWIFMIMTLAAHIGPLGWLMGLGVWLWSIIDTAKKPQDWYQMYNADARNLQKNVETEFEVKSEQPNLKL
jgi:hypothetical protein